MLQLDRTSVSILNIPHYLTLLVPPYGLMRALGKHGFLHWMPDKQYLKVVYRSRTKRKLNLRNPTRYTEKLQRLKLYDRNPLYTTLVDKYAVRAYIALRIENFDAIDWESLPQSFIMKCTHGSGFNMICIDKDSFDRVAARKQFAKWLATNYYWATREWPYKHIKPRIIVEQLLDPPPVDYNSTASMESRSIVGYNLLSRGKNINIFWIWIFMMQGQRVAVTHVIQLTSLRKADSMIRWWILQESSQKESNT